MRIEPHGILYTKVQLEDCEEIFHRTIEKGEPIRHLLFKQDGIEYKSQEEIPFYKKQTRNVLRNCGHIDAEHIQEYISTGGYRALEKALFEMTPEEVIQEISDSNLRGRGGGGFPTGYKWSQVARQKETTRYVVCNGDEGDPGAFMDRSIMEGDPHKMIEGMMIGAYAVGAKEGYIYVRAEYPLAISRLKLAIAQAEECGLLGDHIDVYKRQAVTSNAVCVILGIDYTVNRFAWGVSTVIVGILFSVPAIIGYSSMKWTDYLAVPCGLILCVVGVYLALRNVGWSNIINMQGDGSMSFAAGVTMIFGINVSQLVISADYTRFAKPTWKDNIKIPIGIVGVGVPLIFIGAVMAAGNGTADIVAVMQGLGFPVWGFLVLWLGAWTSQLVNNYTMGLSFSNILNIKTGKGRAMTTLVATLLSIVLALWGILEHFEDFLNMAALIYPPIAGVMFVDFFARKQKWEDKLGWNFMATIAMAIGIVVGYLTTYVKAIGVAPIQSLAVTCIAYYVAMKIKAKVAPDKFTEGMFKS